MSSLVALGEYISTQKGYAFKSKWYVKEGHPIVKVSDFTSDSIDSTKLVLIPGDIASKYSRYALQTNDVVVQTVGSWPSNPASVVGKAIRVPKSVCGALLNQNAVKIIPNEEIDKGFLFYLLRSDLFKDYIVGTAQGAASQASITLDSIKAFTFEVPQLPIQKNIASILSAYDDLIENNNHRITILEEMAQKLYKEWFVKFRFPGHEEVKMVESELGLIPEGWEVVKLSDIAKVNPESITARTAPESIKYVDISSVGTGKIDNVKEMLFSEAPSRARRRVAHQDIIWATVRPNRKQFAYIVNPEENMIVSTGFVVIRAKKVPSSYLYFTVTTDNYVSYLVNNATGSAYPAVNLNEFNNSDIVKPKNELLQKYAEVVDPLLLLIKNLSKKNGNLKKQRDLLLPKLISGKLMSLGDLDV